MTEYPPTSPVYSWPLLEGDAPNDWRDVDDALLAVEETVAAIEAGAGGGDFVQTTGDTMTGPLAFQYEGIETDGAVAVWAQKPLPDSNVAALAFNGSTSQVLVPDSTAFDLAGDFTVELWMREDHSSFSHGESYLLAHSGQGAQWAWFFCVRYHNLVLGARLNYNEEQVEVCLDGTTTVGATAPDGAFSPLTTGTWHHVAASYRASDRQVKLYVDGQVWKTVTPGFSVALPHTSITDAVGIGRNPLGSFSWQGGLDEVRLWSTVRTDAEIAAGRLYSAGGGETGLVACWHFDEGTGTTANDAVGTQDGTITAGTWETSDLPELSAGGTPEWATATTGAIRLPNGPPGRVSWRNAADTTDLPLVVSPDDALLFASSPVVTETIGDSRYVRPTAVDAKGDLLAASAADTLGRLAVGTNGQVLTADSAQTLGVKWATPSAGGSLATDPLADAKGDVFVASAADTVGRLALGTNDQVLTADSTQSLGIKWATPAVQTHGHGGGAGSGGALAAGATGLTLISEQLLSSSATVFTFTSIAQTYRTLVLEVVGRCTTALNNVLDLRVQVNNDTGNNYDWQVLYGISNTTPSTTSGQGQGSGYIGSIPMASTLANAPGWARVEFQLYNTTTFLKTMCSRYSFQTAQTATGMASGIADAVWRSTSAITRLDVFLSSGGAFTIGSYAALYGMS